MEDAVLGTAHYRGLSVDVRSLTVACISSNGHSWSSLKATKADGVDSDQINPLRPRILSDVNLRVPSGAFVAIVGPSGSGKTTLLQCIAARVPFRSGLSTLEALRVRFGKYPFLADGTISFGSHVISGSRPQTCRQPRQKGKLLVFLSRQHEPFYDYLTVEESLLATAQLTHTRTSTGVLRSRVREVISMVDLTVYAETKLKYCSSSVHRCKLAVARALIVDAPIILLDEPTSGLSSLEALQLMQTLKTATEISGRTVVCSLHQPPYSLLAFFHKLVVLSQGKKMFEGTLEDLHFKMAALEHPSADAEDASDLDRFMDIISSSNRADWTDVGLQCVREPSAAEHVDENNVKDSSPTTDVSTHAGISDDRTASLLVLRERQWTPAWYQWRKYTAIVKRSAVNALRNPSVFLIPVLVCLLNGLLIGMVFMNLRKDYTPPNVLDERVLNHPMVKYLTDGFDGGKRPLEDALFFEGVDGRGSFLFPKEFQQVEDAYAWAHDYALCLRTRYDLDSLYEPLECTMGTKDCTEAEATDTDHAEGEAVKKASNEPAIGDHAQRIADVVHERGVRKLVDDNGPRTANEHLPFWEVFHPNNLIKDVVTGLQLLDLHLEPVVDALYRECDPNSMSLVYYLCLAKNGLSERLSPAAECLGWPPLLSKGLPFSLSETATAFHELIRQIGQLIHVPADSTIVRTTDDNSRRMMEHTKSIGSDSEENAVSHDGDDRGSEAHRVVPFRTSLYENLRVPKAVTTEPLAGFFNRTINTENRAPRLVFKNTEIAHEINQWVPDLIGIVHRITWINTTLSDVWRSIKFMSVFFFLTCNLGFAAYSVICSFADERLSVSVELAAGMFSPWTFFTAKNIADNATQIVPYLLMTVSIFLLVNKEIAFAAVALAKVLLIATVFLLTSFGYGYFVGAATANKQQAILLAPIPLVVMILFSGFFIRDGDIPRFLAWLKYFSFYRNSYFALAAANFGDLSGYFGNLPVGVSLGIAGIGETNIWMHIGWLVLWGTLYRFCAFIVLLWKNAV